MSDTPTMMNLFRQELETQVNELTQGLLALEKDPTSKKNIEQLMRAAHSIKGAARVVNLDPVVKLAHALEDLFVSVQKDQVKVTSMLIDIAFKAVDQLLSLSKLEADKITQWQQQNSSSIASSVMELEQAAQGIEQPHVVKSIEERLEQSGPTARVIRLSAQQLNMMMGMSAEFLVQSQWFQPFLDSLIRSKKELDQVATEFELLGEHLSTKLSDEIINDKVSHIEALYHQLSKQMNNHISELELFTRRHLNLSQRFYDGVLSTRMRPFSDVLEGFPRMVRDVAKELGKKVRLEIVGQTTPVDRDILEKLEVPLIHLLRNAIDHGLGTPAERLAVGKPEEGVLRIEASQLAGMLSITVGDDGKGLDLQKIRQKIIDTQLATADAVNGMRDEELLDYLFLPGFSAAQHVTEISGRGIGLNVVQNMIHQVGGVVKIKYEPSKGTTFFLNMPLTLSVMRAFLVEIGGEPYALPLLRIEQAISISSQELQGSEIEGYFIQHQGKKIGVIPAARLLEVNTDLSNGKTVSIVLLSKAMNTFGIIVDRFLDEKELVVRELDPLFGKIPNVAAGAILPDGTPALILDVDQLLFSARTFLNIPTLVSS